MTALRALARHDYDGAEHYLANALAAARGENPNGASGSSKTAASKSGPSTSSTQSAGTAITAGTAVCCQKAAENTGTSGVPRRAATSVSTTGNTSNDPRFSPQQLEDQLDAVTNRNSPFAGFGSPITFRKGDPGVNRLIARDSVASGSVAVYDEFRVGLDVHFVHLDSGTRDGSSGYPFGTLPSYATFGEQSADGLGAEVQVVVRWAGRSRRHIAERLPRSELDRRIAGRHGRRLDAAARLARQREGQPAVVRRDARSGHRHRVGRRGFQFSRGRIRGKPVDHRSIRIGRRLAPPWRKASPTTGGCRGPQVAGGVCCRTTQGELTVGINFTGMHYDRNLNFFSLGHGGYFSPQDTCWEPSRSHGAAAAAASNTRSQAAPVFKVSRGWRAARSDSIGENSSMLRIRGGERTTACHSAWNTAPRPTGTSRPFAGANNARDYASQTISDLAQVAPESGACGDEAFPEDDSRLEGQPTVHIQLDRLCIGRTSSPPHRRELRVGRSEWPRNPNSAAPFTTIRLRVSSTFIVAVAEALTVYVPVLFFRTVSLLYLRSPDR